MDGKVIIGTELDTKKFDKQIEDVEYQLKQIDYELSHAKELKLSNRDIKEYQLKAEKLTNQLVQLKKKKEELNQSNLSNITNEINNIGTGLNNVIGKVTKWTLAIFGVRSAYNFVRSSVSTLSQYNEQLATNIEYIRFALASTLQPVIEKIISLVFTLLQYVNYIAKAWFGVNLFANASTKAFQSNNKSLSSSVKNAKELNRQLAKFDEMNILQEQSQDTSGGSAGGGIVTPDIDLSKIQQVKIPKWLEWLANNKDKILKFFTALGLAIGAIKLAQLLGDFGKLSGILGGLLEIGIIAIGVNLFYKALTGRELIDDLKEIKKGIEDLNAIRDEEQKRAKGSKDATESLISTYNKAKEENKLTEDQTKNYIDTLLNTTNTNENLIASMENQKNWLGKLTGENKKITETQEKYNDTIAVQLEELKKLYDSGQMNSKQKAQYQSLLEKEMGKLVQENSNLNTNSAKFKENAEKIRNTREELEKITGKKYKINSTIQNPDASGFRRFINNLVTETSKAFKNIKFSFSGISIGGGFRAKGGIYYPSKMPKLASGGIINMPGRGVPYHGATIGERGAEAVVPLTDSQQMALLGEAIGRYININLTNVNQMNGRVISREIQKIQNQGDFVMNR